VVLGSVLKSVLRGRRNSDTARIEAEMRRAVTLHASGDIKGAIECLQGISSRNPLHPGAHHLIGLWSGQSGDYDTAGRHLEQAARLSPRDADVHLARGNVYRALGDAKAAEQCYRTAVVCAPHAAAGHYNLGVLLNATGAVDQALQHFERACVLEPHMEEACRERILCLAHLARFAEAEAAAAAAVEASPSSASSWLCLAFVYQKTHRPQQALDCYERSRAIAAPDHELHNNVGIVLQELGRVEEAMEAYRRSLALKPDFHLARFHLSLAGLLTQRYDTAWEDYDLRLLSEDRPRAVRSSARWQGEPLAGRSLLVEGEQGLGDEIMFASCLPDVVHATSRCIVTCSPRLEPLFRRSFPAAVVKGVLPGQATPDETVDFHVPSGSLPRYLRHSLAAFPRHRGYLRADEARVRHWKQRLDGLGSGLKVGISWRGGTYKTRSPLRSVPLEQWLPVLRTPDVRFVSLQYGAVGGTPAEREMMRDHEIEHWPEAIESYDETAALVCALDLTISVCTAVIHLAGALGRPVWIVAPLGPEWRYGWTGDTMPWYPSARIYRQQTLGNWPPVVDAVAHELQDFAAHSMMHTTTPLGPT